MQATEKVKEPMVSVIMNCFNSSEYLQQAIDSVIQQTYQNWEIIFWDNQSTDNSAGIFKNYHDHRLKYYYAPVHTSLGEGRNLAAEKANGEWMAFLDCDDLWLPGKLEKQIQVINRDGADLGLVYGPIELLVNDQRIIRNIARKKLPEGDIFKPLLKENFVPLLSGLIRTEAYWTEGGIDAKLKQSEDYDLFLKVSKNYKAKVINESLAVYRLHENNLSIKQGELNFTESIEIVSNYLPGKAAKDGLKCWYTVYAIYKLKRGQYLNAFLLFVKRGSVGYFIRFVMRFLSAKKTKNFGN